MRKFPKYASYKDSEIKWLQEIPEHWEEIKVKHLFKERSQKGFPDKPLLAATQSGGVIKKEDYETNTVTAQKDFHLLKLVKQGDFVISLRSFQGGIEISYEEGIISPAYTIMQPKNSIDKNYYKHLYKSKYFIDGLATFVTGIREGQNIDYSKFRRSNILLPPISEQSAIANFLDKKTAEIKEFIALKEKTIELLKERKMAIINELVTGKKVWNGSEWAAPTEVKDSGIEWLGEIPKHWEVKKLKYFVDFVNRGSTPNYVEVSESKVVNQATFSKGFWNESEIKFTLVKSPDDTRGLLIDEDILMASTGGGLLGKVGFFKNLSGSYIADSHVTIIRDSKKRIFPLFYYYLFSTLYSWIDGTLSKGSTNQIELQRELLRGSKFPFPCFKDQHRIVQLIEIKLTELDSLIEQTKKEISIIKEYQQSLISEVVTGKVDVSALSEK